MITHKNVSGRRPFVFFSSMAETHLFMKTAWRNAAIVCVLATLAGCYQSPAEQLQATAKSQVQAVINKLKELNPRFDGKLMHKIENGVVTEIEFNVRNVSDISPVRDLVGLRRFRCYNNAYPEAIDLSGEVVDLSPLMGMPLDELHVCNTQLSDLSPLKDMRLTKVNCSYTKVSDLSPLKDMELNQLNCSGTDVSDLSPLKDIKLKKLICSFTKVSNLSPLKAMKLTELNCHFTMVSDLSPVKDMELKKLNCGFTEVSDLSPIKDMKLTELNCSGTGVSDLSPLKGMRLKELYLYPSKVEPEGNIDILRSITTLERIDNKPTAEFWEEVDKQ